MTFYLLRPAAPSGLFPTIGFQIITESRSTEDFPSLRIDRLSNLSHKPADLAIVGKAKFCVLFRINSPADTSLS
jgi:hypothetical protein